MYATAKYMPLGDKALVVEFGGIINPDINRKVHSLHEVISNAAIPGVHECVPTYRSLLVAYDPMKVSYEKLVSRVKSLEKRSKASISQSATRTAVIPVAYGEDFGPDIGQVAQHHNLKDNDVICIHSAREYLVYMIGFIAGFPYLGELDDQIATPRLESPRIRVPEGSVGIAEKQTGIYPREAPGGWRIIGRTPLRLFDPSWQPPALLQPGDTVRFKPISIDEFRQIHVEVSKGSYDPFTQE